METKILKQFEQKKAEQEGNAEGGAAGDRAKGAKGSDKKGGKKDEDEHDDFEDDLSEVEDLGPEDGRMYRKCKSTCCFLAKFQCFNGSSLKSKVTVLFSVCMITMSITKLVFADILVTKIETEDLTSDYVDFKSYLIATDVLVLIDLMLFLMLILVLASVMFTWLPQVFGGLLDLFTRYLNM